MFDESEPSAWAGLHEKGRVHRLTRLDTRGPAETRSLKRLSGAIKLEKDLG